ncbi:unnamed protein product [marine sediment metagenome]|uniref:Small basic protein n=1 Tax=marine sediment metagenome TaxID=412755 RepID=X0SEE7_9ZZZZ
MSIHKSLKSKGKLKRHRSVLTRTERLDALKNEERWQDGDSIYGLPKVRVIRAKRKKAKKEEEVDEAALVGEGIAGEAAAGEAAGGEAAGGEAAAAKAAPKKGKEA